MLFSISIIVVILVVSGFSFYKTLSNSIKDTVGVNSLEITYFLSKLPAVVDALKDPDQGAALQQIYEEYISEINGNFFLVLIDQEGVRHTHRDPTLIGQQITGDDVEKALSGEAYISTAHGISGPTLRTFAPVVDPETNTQIGVLALGFSQEKISDLVKSHLDSILFWLLMAFTFGIVASILLAKAIKRILFNHEPEEIAKLFREKEAILESLSEGIIVINQDNNITLVNKAAKSILNLPKDIDENKIYELVEEFSIVRIINSPLQKTNIELNVNGTIILASYSPITQKNKNWGYIIAFRDISEARKLAEDLTGVNQYIDGLRAKTHEFSNKLQTLSGLIELEQYEEVLTYISTTNVQQQNLLDSLTNNISEPKILGLLLGKIQQAVEHNVQITFTPGSYLGKISPFMPVDSIALIIGNLLQNAIDAVKEKPFGEVQITLLDKKDKLIILVEDNGDGIKNSNENVIFKKGYSTKGTYGYGLFLVKHHTENILGGTLHFSQDEGTSFTIQIPKAG
ncbi:ATP-binding protein [Halalkalibacter krulwichiae]